LQPVTAIILGIRVSEERIIFVRGWRGITLLRAARTLMMKSTHVLVLPQTM
jgi:hypothetical protein